MLLFGLGLSATVAPLTSTILGAISEQQSGIGSAVNNAVSRVAGLVAVAPSSGSSSGRTSTWPASIARCSSRPSAADPRGDRLGHRHPEHQADDHAHG
ncbi:MAG: hypothetical protein WDM88_13535 [Galbitalea sp.]